MDTASHSLPPPPEPGVIDPLIYIRIFIKRKKSIATLGIVFALLAIILQSFLYFSNKVKLPIVYANIAVGRIDNQPIAKLDERIASVKNSREIQTTILAQLQAKDGRWALYDHFPPATLFLVIANEEQTVTVISKLQNETLNRMFIQAIIEYLTENHDKLFNVATQRIDESIAILEAKLSLLETQQKLYENTATQNRRQVERFTSQLNEAGARALTGLIPSLDAAVTKLTQFEIDHLATTQELANLKRIKSETRPTSVEYHTVTYQAVFLRVQTLLLAFAALLVGLCLGSIWALIAEWWYLNRIRL